MIERYHFFVCPGFQCFIRHVFWNILSLLVTCLLVFLIVALSEQKCLILIKPIPCVCLFACFIYLCVEGFHSLRCHYLHPSPEGFLRPSSRRFYISLLALGIWSVSKVIFWYVVFNKGQSTFFHINIQLFHWKLRGFSLPLNDLGNFVKNQIIMSVQACFWSPVHLHWWMNLFFFFLWILTMLALKANLEIL